MWIGDRNDYHFYDSLIQSIHMANIFTLVDARAEVPQAREKLGWKLAVLVGLEGIEVEEWNHFIGIIFAKFIKLQEDELDSLC
jgi:hypothetical protein